MNTTSGEGYPTPQEPSAGEDNEAMRRILASRRLVSAPTQQKFMRLICDSHLNGRASELKEYMIGYEIYDRDGSYNPATENHYAILLGGGWVKEWSGNSPIRKCFTMLQTLGAFPRYFQVFLKVSVDNGIPTNISAVRVRKIKLKK
jgi:hypothetical protein